MALRNKKSKLHALFPGLSENPKGFGIRAACIFLLVLTGLWNLKASFLAQLEMNKGTNMANFSFALSDPDALSRLARKEHLTLANLPLALDLYKKALDNFVLHVPSWLGLAEIFHDQGNDKQGREALAFVQNFSGNNANLAWSKTLLADMLGQEEIMSANLLWMAKNVPARRVEVFSFAALRWDDPLTLMNKFGAGLSMEILDTYMRNNDIPKTWIVWSRMEQEHKTNANEAVKYIDFLLKSGELGKAVQVWKDSVNPDGPLLYNGNFAKPIIGSAFGWRIAESKGSAWKKGGFNNGLEISFDGTENVNFQLAQTVPIYPGKYIFSGTFESDHLTTDERPYWKISSGLNCSGMQAEQPLMVPPSGQQTEFLIRFTVPEQCETVQIALSRNRSFHFDNKISGRVIVNNLQIKPADTSDSGAPLPAIKQSAEKPPPSGKKQETHFTIKPLEVWP